VGTEQVRLDRTPDGWTLVGSGRIGPPVDVISRRVALRYDADWQPLEIDIDATMQGRASGLRTHVTGTTASSVITLGDATTETTHSIEPASVLLPNPFFVAYEAVAARLRDAVEGATIPVYVAPQGSMTIAVGASSTETIQTVARTIQARRTRITINEPGVLPIAAEIWGDESGRLLRLSVPTQSLEVVREDLASVSSRRVTVARPGDEDVHVPANGFLLAGTLSRPANATAARLPAVVLVGGSAPVDRDETVAGIPIFGQLADALANAGYLVLRYDKRGVGQSGGRPEAATLDDYAEDLRAAVRFLTERRDVDRRRIAVIGHGEGGMVSMLAASRDNRIAGLVMISSAGTSGAELNIAQVERAVGRAAQSDTQRQETIALQKRIQQAVLSGKGWEGIPPHLRQQADTPWFRSFLAFDPARTMRDVRQSVLVVQGMLDTQVLPGNADRLEQLAQARRRDDATVEVVRVAGINHLLVPATTGEIEEYGTLPDRHISPEVSRAIADWMNRTLTGN
jgi:alpha-beta hydrolase superfamily lysophospholipase